jgi:hypothetical protein
MGCTLGSDPLSRRIESCRFFRFTSARFRPQTSDARNPCRYAIRIIAQSRADCRRAALSTGVGESLVIGCYVLLSAAIHAGSVTVRVLRLLLRIASHIEVGVHQIVHQVFGQPLFSVGLLHFAYCPLTHPGPSGGPIAAILLTGAETRASTHVVRASPGSALC